MIKVLSVNKQGNRIISYTCTDGSRTIDLTKGQLSNYISNKQVINATQQIYKGNTIIRIKSDTYNRLNSNMVDTQLCNNENKYKTQESVFERFKNFLDSIDDIVILSFNYNSSENKLEFRLAKKAMKPVSGAPMMYGLTLKEAQERNNECCSTFTIDLSNIENSKVKRYVLKNMYNLESNEYSLCTQHLYYKGKPYERLVKVWIEEGRCLSNNAMLKIDTELTKNFGLPIIDI